MAKLGHRYYDPGTGRFTQQDALQILANPSNGNLYAYAGDSPNNYIDPTGTWSWPSAIFGLVVGYFVATICYGVSAGLAPETGGLSLGIAAGCGTVTTFVVAGVSGK